jgi:hypothetical protein
MSITDIAAGRISPAQTFALHYVAPAPPRPQRVTSAILQAARRYWREFPGFPARLPRLLPESGQSLARLAAFLWPHLKALTPTLRRREARSHKAAIRALLRPATSVSFLRRFAYVIVVGMVGFTAAYFVRSAPVVLQAQPLPAVEWRQVAKPFAAFSLPMPELAQSGRDLPAA